MQNEKRTHEAAILRDFLDEQISHLQNLLGDFVFKSPVDQELAEQQLIVESFVDAANAKLRVADHYVERLRPPVCALYRHLQAIAQQIPPPLELSRRAFARDATVNALFVNAGDIDRLIKGNRLATNYVSTHRASFYALMTAQKTESTLFGVGLQGEMLVREVSQRAINFSAHKLHSPCDSKEALEQALRRFLFEEAVKIVKQSMDELVIAETLKSGKASYETILHSLANPSVYLDTLIAYLQPVENLLKLEKFRFKLSKLGVKLECDDGQCINEFEIHELTWRGQHRFVLMQIVYSAEFDAV